MGPSDKDNILYSVNPQPKLSCPREPAVDMPGYPLGEVCTRYRVLRFSIDWKA